VSTKRPGPGPARVAWWLRALKIYSQGCIRLVPDPAEPLDVAACNQARRQLTTQARAQARAEPEPTP
jgi:hypothetical protein